MYAVGQARCLLYVYLLTSRHTSLPNNDDMIAPLRLGTIEGFIGHADNTLGRMPYTCAKHFFWYNRGHLLYRIPMVQYSKSDNKYSEYGQNLYGIYHHDWA